MHGVSWALVEKEQRPAHLCDQLALLELAIDQDHVAVLIHLCTAQPRLQGRLGRRQVSRREHGELAVVGQIARLQGWLRLPSG